jgi:TRAP-type C4-dicarboxylate transport system substrate-binding protein
VTSFTTRLKTLGAAAVAGLILTGSAQALTIKGNEITLRLGSGHPPFITYIKQLKAVFIPRVMARVAKETKYKIKFKEHYAATVVNVFDTLEGVQDGRLDLGGWCVCFDDDKAMAMNFAFYVPFSHPNAITSRLIGRKLLAKFPQLFQDYEKRYNQKLLGFTGFNNYGLLTAFNWKTFGDLKGHKILAAGPNLPWVKGGIPVRTSIPKAAQQLSTGVGEGIVLFPDTDYKLKLHEAIKRKGVYTITDFGAVLNINLTMNLNTRKKLPKEVVKIIDEVAVEWEKATSEAAEKDHQWGLDKLKSAGIKIRRIDPAARVAWANALKDWPNERAAAVKAKKGINMAAAMRAFIKLNEEAGHKFPVNYVIKD